MTESQGVCKGEFYIHEDGYSVFDISTADGLFLGSIKGKGQSFENVTKLQNVDALVDVVTLAIDSASKEIYH